MRNSTERPFDRERISIDIHVLIQLTMRRSDPVFSQRPTSRKLGGNATFLRWHEPF